MWGDGETAIPNDEAHSDDRKGDAAEVVERELEEGIRPAVLKAPTWTSESPSKPRDRPTENEAPSWRRQILDTHMRAAVAEGAPAKTDERPVETQLGLQSKSEG
ncbi:hypothetical protein CSUI_000866 [Cystoisospora suis]|uniref:Uncharacterized protein n=1 Tax=Cystoisospora suis TaxID=483139 RepID=A0A2C6LEG7_9APIC|nr:hypothetical protein CSUI_000866 [Cystoisospora suis]